MKFSKLGVAAASAVAITAAAIISAPNAGAAPRESKACAAFARWDHARTMPNLFALLTASESAPWVPVGTDVIVLYTDWRDHDTFDRASDISALGQDCRR